MIGMEKCKYKDAAAERRGIDTYPDIVLNPFMRKPDSYYSNSRLSIQQNGIDYTIIEYKLILQ